MIDLNIPTLNKNIIPPSEVATSKLMVREYLPAIDEGFVFDSWGRQIRKLYPFKEYDKDEFKQHLLKIERLVSEVQPVVACNPDCHDQNFGFICSETRGDNQVLHFLYVRNMWRQMGIATALLKISFPSLGKKTLWFTHPTKAVKHHQERWRLKYNPYLIG